MHKSQPWSDDVAAAGGAAFLCLAIVIAGLVVAVLV